MGTEFKGRAWFGNIYHKLENILVEVDTFTAQNTLCLNSSDSEWESVRSEPEEVAEEQTSGSCDLLKENDSVDLPSCERPSDPPSVQNFDISGIVRVEERVQGDSLEEFTSDTTVFDGEIFSGAPLLQEYCHLTSASTTLGDEEPVITDEESRITNTLRPQENASVFVGEERVEEDVVESCRDDVSVESQSTQCSVESFGMITTTLSPSVGDLSVFPSEESLEVVRVESCRDYVSIESQSTQSFVESFGTDIESQSTQSSMDDSNLNHITTKILDVHVQDNMESIWSSNDGNLDDVINGKSDVSPLDSKALHGMEIRKDPSFVDDNALYAVRLRTEKLKSFKRKILDALNSKRIREEEYEQLSIWFGDADMGSDMATRKGSKHLEAAETDSKSSQVHESEDPHWELL